MLRVIGRRLALAVPTVFVVATFTFFLIHLVPGSPANYILGGQPTAEQIANLNRDLGLDQPAWVQYVTWLGRAIRGDFGASYYTQNPVSEDLLQTLEPTLSLALLSTLFGLVIGLALGTVAAVRGGWLDRLIQAITSLGLAVPAFWLGALIVYVFALELGWFPAVGYKSFATSPGLWVAYLALPIGALVLSSLAQIVVQARASVLDVLSRDFVRTLQALGLPRGTILFKHVLRNAAIPVATIAGITFIYSLSGVVVIEYLFNIPGMGTLIVNSANRHDIPVMQGAVMYFSIVVVIVTLLTDLITAWLNPRIHVS